MGGPPCVRARLRSLSRSNCRLRSRLDRCWRHLRLNRLVLTNRRDCDGCVRSRCLADAWPSQRGLVPLGDARHRRQCDPIPVSNRAKGCWRLGVQTSKVELEHVHIEKPTEQQVTGQFLAEGALAAHRIQADQQAGFEQPFGRNGGSPLAVSGIHLIEQRRQLRHSRVGEALDGPQRMIGRDQRNRIDKCQDARLLLGAPARPLCRYCLRHRSPVRR